MVDRRTGQLLEPEIGARIQLEDIDPRQQQVDKRQEKLAIQAICIQVLRRSVGGGDQHHAALEQHREQPPQDHRVGDVGHAEFVETQQPRLVRQRVGDRGYGIAGTRAPLLPLGVDAARGPRP